MDAYGLLRLQMEWGADEALDEAPVDRLRAARPAAAPLVRAPAAPMAAPMAAPVAPPVVAPAAERARIAAEAADSLDDLRTAVAAFDGCPLRDTATNLVFATGGPSSPILVIGDPPNADEDRSGTPFAGTDGQFLDMLLGSAGMQRGLLLLTPLLPWRPPGGRPATAAEVAACLPFLHRLIVLAQPARLVLTGPQAVRAMIGTRPRAASAAQGGIRKIACPVPGLAEPIEALLLPFPAAALRQPAARREAWAALRRMRRVVDTRG